MAASKPQALADRVRTLIDIHYGGSVSAAARAMDIVQGTLANIVNGESESPRASVLSTIADHFGTTIDWLLNGRGDAPPNVELATEVIAKMVAVAGRVSGELSFPRTGMAGRRWYQLVAALLLSDDGFLWLYSQPFRTYTSAMALAYKRGPTDEESFLPTDSRTRLVTAMCDAWATYLEEMIEAIGAGEVRKRVEREKKKRAGDE